MPSSHTASISLPVSTAMVFELLVKPAHIKQWWGASTVIVQAAEDGFWAAAWGDADDPQYTTCADIEVLEPGTKLKLSNYRYHSIQPLPFETEFTVTFTISSAGNNSVLSVTQSGFPDGPAANEYYKACESGWADTLSAIKNYCETLR